MRQAIIYIRTSSTEQTPELQLADIGTLKPPIDAIIIQEQESAYKDSAQRPEMKRIISEIKNKRVRELYVWDFDRVHRNRLKLREFLTLCKACEVSIHSYNQNWIEVINDIPYPFNDIFLEFLINMIGWMAEEEVKKKSNRVKMAVRRTAKGTVSYNGNRWGRKPFPKQTITRVMELHKEGVSVRGIAKQVQVYDKNNNGRLISKSAVHKIIAEFNHEKGS